MKGMSHRKVSEQALVQSIQKVNGGGDERTQIVGTKGHRDNKEKTEDRDFPEDKKTAHTEGGAKVLEPTQGQTEEDSEDPRSTPGRQSLVAE